MFARAAGRTAAAAAGVASSAAQRRSLHILVPRLGGPAIVPAPLFQGLINDAAPALAEAGAFVPPHFEMPPVARPAGGALRDVRSAASLAEASGAAGTPSRTDENELSAILDGFEASLALAAEGVWGRAGSDAAAASEAAGAAARADRSAALLELLESTTITMDIDGRTLRDEAAESGEGEASPLGEGETGEVGRAPLLAIKRT
jgi:large subunit ribosomal protein L34